MRALQVENLKSLPGADDISRMVLDNGITILVRSNYNSPSIVVTGYLNAGSVFDSDEKLGLAYFTSVGLMRGTQQKSFQEIYDSLETVGASLGFSASALTTAFSGRSLVEDLPLLLTLLSECLRNPIFPSDQIEKLRAQLMTGLAIRAQDTAELVALKFDEILFKGHPFARPEDGHPDTIQHISRADLQDFHTSHFGPKGMVMIAVGAISAPEAFDQISKVLGDWVNPDQPDQPRLPAIKPPARKNRKHLSLPGKTQTDLILGTLGPKRISEDFLPASLGNNILGQFGMMGRIGDVVREQTGLAYHASTSLNCGIEIGTWEVTAGVNPKNLNRAIKLIEQELHRFITEKVTKGELGDSKANFIGRLPLSMESNAGVASALLNLERYQLGLDYYREYPDKVHAVTPEAILAIARRYLDPEKLVIVSSGPPLVKPHPTKGKTK
jgi:zinc protease